MTIRVQFIHGLEGSPHGHKAQLLAQHFRALTPQMDTTDFEKCLLVQSDAISTFRPDVLVGSSFGGAIALALLQRGLWQGPTLLLAQAGIRYGLPAILPTGVPVWIVHGLRDIVIDPEDSRLLAKHGKDTHVRLIEVDDDHGLYSIVGNKDLVDWVDALASLRSDQPTSASSDK